MEGLEVNILEKSNLENHFTIGAEFYLKEYTSKIDNILNSGYNVKILSNISKLITDGDHGAPNYQDTGVLYLLSESIKEGYIDTTIHRYILPELHAVLSRSALKPGDVLVTKTGAYFGKSAVVPPDFPESNTSAHVGIIRLKSINPFYVSTFLNSSYGYSQLRRRGIKATRPEIKLVEFSDIKIPIPSNEFQSKIEIIITKAHEVFEASLNVFHDADDILLVELGLKDWAPTNQNSTTKSFADFLGSGRLDAEYYQPKYDDLFAHLNQYKTKPLGKIVTITKSIEPGSEAYQDSGTPFVRVANLSKYGLSDTDIFLDGTMCKDVIKPKKDTILLTKDGSVGIAYKVVEDMDVITSGAILHLDITDVDFLPDYLTLVLNSIIVKMQAERDAGGSIIQHWKPSEIEQVIIPRLNLNIQQQITDKVQKSFELRAESKRLLDLAKTAVEIAIEQGEQKALELLKQN